MKRRLPVLTKKIVLNFVAGDVSGKGIPAALFMAIAKTLLNSHAEQFDDITMLAVKLV